MVAENTQLTPPVVSVKDVAISFRIKSGRLRPTVVDAVRGVSLDLHENETFGLLGESGSGKSTLGRILMQLESPDRGQVSYKGQDVSALSRQQRRSVRQKLQVVFQDPFASFDPSVSLWNSLREPLQVHTRDDRRTIDGRIIEVVEAVGLTEKHLSQFPRQLSGGQLQRMAIGRALTVQPEVILLDEPVSALDMSTQAQIINLLIDLQKERGLTYLMISHNPAIVYHVSHRIGVMRKGELVEVGSAADVRFRPQHPYTKQLLAAELTGDPAQPRALPLAAQTAVKLVPTGGSE